MDMMSRMILLISISLVTWLTGLAQDTEPLNQRESHRTKKKEFALFGKLVLGQNEPNPFFTSEATHIVYKAYAALSISIVIYDFQSTRIKSYTHLAQGAGEITVQGNEIPSGIYYYALLINGRIVEKKRIYHSYTCI